MHSAHELCFVAEIKAPPNRGWEGLMLEQQLKSKEDYGNSLTR
jgi:hypothetical protein